MAEDTTESSKDPEEAVWPYVPTTCMVGGGGPFKRGGCPI